MAAVDMWSIGFLVEAARQTPGQKDADKFLREVQPGDLDRLTQQHQNDPADRFFGVPTGGGGIAGGGGMNYGSEGYNAPGIRYPGGRPEGVEHDDHYSEDSYDDDSYDENEGDDYHIVTRPRDAIYGLNVFDEHPYHAFGSGYLGTASSAMDMFAEDHPEYDTERNPDTATHEIIHAHSPEHHDSWHRNLADEDEAFNSRIAPHGFHRESPDVPGHRAYRHEEPNGVVHRLWHSPYHTDGHAWQTSRHDPRYERDRQLTLWTRHPDVTSRDSLGDALSHIERNKNLVDPRG